MVCRSFVSHVYSFFHLSFSRNKQTPVRFTRSRIRTCCRLHDRVLIDVFCAIFPWRIRKYDHDERHCQHLIPWWMAPALRCSTAESDTRRGLVCGKNRILPFRIYLGAGHIPALSIRSTYAPGLEGISSTVTHMAGTDRWFPRVF